MKPESSPGGKGYIAKEAPPKRTKGYIAKEAPPKSTKGYIAKKAPPKLTKGYIAKEAPFFIFLNPERVERQGGKNQLCERSTRKGFFKEKLKEKTEGKSPH